jgi:uncharacterized repeat protein (TIGR02543 family)
MRRSPLYGIKRWLFARAGESLRGVRGPGYPFDMSRRRASCALRFIPHGQLLEKNYQEKNEMQRQIKPGKSSLSKQALSLALSFMMILSVITPFTNNTAYAAALPAAVEETQVGYNHYYGVLHSHSAYSDNQVRTSTPTTAFDYAKYTAGVDFLAVTDHSEYLDTAADPGDLYIGGGANGHLWESGQREADEANSDGEFVAIYAYEMTWPGMYPTPGFGHMNTFNTTGYVSVNNPRYAGNATSVNPFNYYDDIAAYEGSISMFNHPTGRGYVLGSGGVFGDFQQFAGWTPERDKAFSLIEIGNGSKQTTTALTGLGVLGELGNLLNSVAYIQMEKDFNVALEKGWHLAPTNNQDNHQANWGNANTHRTVLLAEDLTRESLYDAMRNRRAYATENQTMKIDYSVNGEVMGTIFEYNPDTLNISVSISNETNFIGTVSLVAGNRFQNGSTRVVKSETFNTFDAEWDFTIDAGFDYYYIKIQQPGSLNDGRHLSYTAPVWVNEAPDRIVSFDLNGGESEPIEDVIVTRDTVAEPENIPTRTGYTFIGWLLNGEAYDFDAPVTRDITLVADWECNSYAAEAFVTKLNGNKNDLTITVTETDAYGVESVYTETFSIRNNEAGLYAVNRFYVYVDTKGDVQIRAIYIAE